MKKNILRFTDAEGGDWKVEIKPNETVYFGENTQGVDITIIRDNPATEQHFTQCADVRFAVVEL